MSPARATWPARTAGARFATGVFEVADSSTTRLDLEPLVGPTRARDPHGLAELRGQALLEQNRGLLRDYQVTGHVGRRAGVPELVLTTGTCVGSLPLLSPVTGRVDYGLVIRPRFQWAGVGEVLGQMGLKVVPDLLALPELPRSERRIPGWVLSSIVLWRLEALLGQMERRFEFTQADRRAPRGRVDWTRYAVDQVSRGRPDLVPCRFPDLSEDEALRAAIHHVLRLQQASLASQRHAGFIVLELLALCEQLLHRVSGTPPRPPPDGTLAAWRRRPLSTRPFTEGLQAIEWTVDERGLAGMSDLTGLPWRLEMSAFFEAWVETIAERLARRMGGLVRSGRNEQTRVPLRWEPSFGGSQRSLLPDVVIEREDLVIVLEAKYKRHLEEIERTGWRNLEDELREHHRDDLLQALAYSTLFGASRVVACLLYPCTPATYTSLVARGRAVSRTRVVAGERQVDLALAAAPMGMAIEEVVRGLESLVDRP